VTWIHSQGTTHQEVTPFLLAVCGLNVRKVIKKTYKTGDLWSRGTQVCEKDFNRRELLQGDIVKRMRHTYEIIDLPTKPKAKIKAKTKVK
jgi:hypothetical protein